MKKSSEKPLPSKVLLLCIDNKNNSILTQKFLYSLFSGYGTPKQVNIIIYSLNINIINRF